MSKGHIFLAQNSETNYVRQAYALALSIKSNNKKFKKTCLITNDVVPEEYKSAFDYIVPIPWDDSAKDSSWKVENRWKIVYASPFKENLVYDTDMLLLSTNDHWWDYFQGRDLVLTSTVFDYRKEVINSTYYRKGFVENNLKNVYTGCFYFKKSSKGYEFFKWLEIIFNNWDHFNENYFKNKQQSFFSLDVASAMALKFMGIEDEVLNNNLCPSFIHMKPNIQKWNNIPKRWTDVLNCYFEKHLYIENIIQKGLFHYVEDNFLTNEIILKLEKNA